MFSKAVEQQVIQHALEEFPKECCGLIIDDGAEYVPFKNIHETPKTDFRMALKEFNDYYLAGRVSALMHSHTQSAPFKNNFPSRKDMISQEQMQLPWGIVHIDQNKTIDGPFYFGDGIPIADLIGRDFRPNIYDCYTLLRDKYRLENITTLPIFPREGFWWDKKGDMLSRNFEKAGFVEIDRTQLRKNDVILDSINAPRNNKVLNHVMIVLGNGQILHHLSKRLSKPDPIQPWIKPSCVFLRYKGGKN